MVNQNMHIHSKYSWDSKMQIEEIAKILYKNGIKYFISTQELKGKTDKQTTVVAYKCSNRSIYKLFKK